MPFLVFENGPDKGRKIELIPGRVYTAGQDPACDIPLNEAQAAPKHFKIGEHKKRFYIRDLGSQSGLLVNHSLKKQAALDFNDKIQVGDTVLSFVEEARQDPMTGKTIEGYEILELLGWGGMGKVYRARQLSLNREVAIKLLSPRLTRDAVFRERFIQEARAAGSFNHPNVLQVYDVIHAGDLCFYSMEYIPGGTVENLIQKGQVPLDQALRIIKDAVLGLVYAEQKQIVHHDIKPQNLMITELGTTKIADMGLACSIEDTTKDDKSNLIGTPHFISPERIQRKDQDIRSDIYSLGGTFYMILTGKPPFHGDTVKEILRKQLKEEPPSIREIRPEVPDSILHIIQTMMAKDPSERQKSAMDLLEDLNTVKLSKKRGPLVALVSVPLLVIVSFLVYLQISKNPESPSPLETHEASKPADVPGEATSQELADLKKQMEETQAYNTYLLIPEDLDEGKRVEQLEKISKRFPGTPTAQKAQEEAQKIRETMIRKKEMEAERFAQVKVLKEEAGSMVQSLLSNSRFFDAVVYTQELGKKQGLFEDSEVMALRALLLKEVDQASGKQCEASIKASEALLEKSDFEGAREELETGSDLFRGSSSSALEGEGAALLEKVASRFSKELGAVAKAERDFHLALFDEDLTRCLSSLSPSLLRTKVLAYQFDEAEEAYAGAVSGLKTRAYQEHMERLKTGIYWASRLLQKFRSALEEGRLMDEVVPCPGEEENTSGTLSGLNEDLDGLKILITQGKRSRLSNVPFYRFDRAELLVDLLNGRFPMEGQDKLGLAEAALHFASARCAAHLAPLERQVKTYDPEEGWSQKARTAAALMPFRFEAGLKIEQLVDEAEGLDPSLSPQCAALKERMKEEAAAVDYFYLGIEPFIQRNTQIGFDRAEDLLDRFAKDYSQTIFFWYLLDLMGGSTRPGQHLVEFSR